MLQAASTITVCGASSSGKSTWVYKLLKNAATLFSEPPVHISFFYNTWQKLYSKMTEEFNQFISFEHGLPSKQKILELSEKYNGKHQILVIDDLNQLYCSSEVPGLDVQKLFFCGELQSQQSF